jgi:hypothetical protein
MNVGIGNEAAQFHLFRISVQCLCSVQSTYNTILAIFVTFLQLQCTGTEYTRTFEWLLVVMQSALIAILMGVIPCKCKLHVK